MLMCTREPQRHRIARHADACRRTDSVQAAEERATGFSWTTTLTYSDATTPTLIAPRPGLLISVKNHFGRELRFTYDAAGQLVELLPPGALSGQPAGSAVSPIRYVYGEPASLGAGVPAQSQLTSIVWQDGSVRRYHHEDGRWPQSVTGITDEAGVRYGTYAYDDQGRVTRSELAGGAERLDFAYGQDASGKPTTAVTDYTGAGGAATTRSYTFADIGNVRCGCSPPERLRRWRRCAARRDRTRALRQQPRALQPSGRQAQDEQLQRSPSRRAAPSAAPADAGVAYLNSIGVSW